MGSLLVNPTSALAAAGIVGQWRIDGKSETISLDRAAVLFLFGDEQMAGLPIPLSQMFDLAKGDDRAFAVDVCQRSLATGGSNVMELRVATAAAGERLVQVRGYFAWDEGGGMVGQGVLIDVTDFARQPVSCSAGAAAAMECDQAPLLDPLAEAAERSIEVRKALGRSGHGALRLAADLLLWEINTAMAARHTISDKRVPDQLKQLR